MKQLLTRIVDTLKGKHPLAAKRSNQWPTARKAHLELYPACAVCGGSVDIQVHHIRPFHLHPDLELDPGNLVTLCESKKAGVNCHLWFGHLGNFKSYNTTVTKDAPQWYKKFKSRP